MAETRHVYALFESVSAAASAREALEACGCSGEACSVVTHRDHLELSDLTREERAGTEGAKRGAVAGGATGAVLGGLVAVGGGLLAVGPFAAAALAGGVMAAYGALIGGIAGADEPEAQLRSLQADLQAGKVLIAVETDDAELARKSKLAFERAGGSMIVA